MKRDMELVRQILLCVEDIGECNVGDVVGYLREKDRLSNGERETVLEHCRIMAEGKLIHYSATRVAGPRRWVTSPISLTWDGHEYIDSVRDSSIWEKVKKKIGYEKISQIPFNVISSVAQDAIKDAL